MCDTSTTSLADSLQAKEARDAAAACTAAEAEAAAEAAAAAEQGAAAGHDFAGRVAGLLAAAADAHTSLRRLLESNAAGGAAAAELQAAFAELGNATKVCSTLSLKCSFGGRVCCLNCSMSV